VINHLLKNTAECCRT